MTGRCAWAPLHDALYLAYHDQEWGVPVHDDHKIFEHLILEGFQAGLSWSTVLHKRENFRAAFDGFAAEKIARYNDEKIAALLANPGIIRNRLKVAAAITNARAFLAVQQEFGSFDAYIWDICGGAARQNAWEKLEQVPASTPESDRLSKELLQRGFKFVGSTICYAHMQATGMVNDHTLDCFRHAEVAAMK